MTDHIVIGNRVLLDASFGAARARLQILAREGMLLRASEAAYGEAITGLVQAAGPAAGLTRLAGICLEDLAETGDCAHIALQWEAIAADGTLFIALDAALLLVPAANRSPRSPWPERTGHSLARPAPSWTRGSCAAAPPRQSAASWTGWRAHWLTLRARQGPGRGPPSAMAARRPRSGRHAPRH